jgi:hypothetical protein
MTVEYRTSWDRTSALELCPTCGGHVDQDAHDTLDAAQLDRSDAAARSESVESAVVYFHEDCYPHASSRYRLL